MKHILLFFVCVFLFCTNSLAYAECTFTGDLTSISEHATSSLASFGFDDKDFLHGSYESGLFAYMYNDVFYLSVNCDSSTHHPTSIQIRVNTKDVNQFLKAASACTEIAVHSTGVDTSSVSTVFNEIINSMYIQSKSFLVDGFVFDILYYDCISPYEIRFDIYPDDGSYVEPQKKYSTNWTYDQLARNPEYYLCSRYSVRGKIESIDGSRSDGYSVLLSSPANSGKYFYVYINPTFAPSYNLLLGDIVTFKCIFGGDYRYQNIFGAYTTLPILFVEDTVLHK